MTQILLTNRRRGSGRGIVELNVPVQGRVQDPLSSTFGVDVPDIALSQEPEVEQRRLRFKLRNCVLRRWEP